MAPDLDHGMAPPLQSSVVAELSPYVVAAQRRRVARVSSARYHTLEDAHHSKEALLPGCLKTVAKIGEGAYAVVQKAWWVWGTGRSVATLGFGRGLAAGGNPE
jgi:hypothetical protein